MPNSNADLIYEGDSNSYVEENGDWIAKHLVCYRDTTKFQFGAAKIVALGYDCDTSPVLEQYWNTAPTTLQLSSTSQTEVITGL